MTTQSVRPTTTSSAHPRPASRWHVSPVVGGRAAMAYGFLAMSVGAAQAVRSGDTSVQIATGMRWILVVFAVSLLVVVPAHLALGAFARSPWGARIARAVHAAVRHGLEVHP